jgi:hypothetical protein
MADVDYDPVISDELIIQQLGRSIDKLFDRFLDKYKSGRTFFFFKEALTRSDRTFGDALYAKANSKESDQILLTKLKEQTNKIVSDVRAQMNMLDINTPNIPNVIGYVCDFVNHIEIKIDEKDKLSPTLVIHDCQGKHFSITKNLYCPAQSLFITLMDKLCANMILIPGTPNRPSRFVKFKYEIPVLDNSSFARNQSTCKSDETTTSESLASQESQESQESQGGSKSRHTHRRKHRRYSKHPRKTRHKRGERRVRSYAKRRCASKSHKCRRSR